MKHRCPCCGYNTMQHQEAEYHDICPVCFWENDPLQNVDSTYSGGANEVSLCEAKKNFVLLGAISKDMIKYTREPFDDEK